MGSSARQAVAAGTAPPESPILRIEAGTHTASINRFGVDAANRILVTSSYDKTIRVWALPKGELIRVIRMPIDAGKEGALYALAVSPDGKRIVAGGWTGGWGEDWSLYLFETASGQMIRRIGDLPLRPLHLAFSQDGNYLAVTFKSEHGLRIYDAKDFRLVAEDKDYEDDTLSAEFAQDGRLVTASLDGHVRLYDASFRRIAKTPSLPARIPVMASFSPDGEKIAVGYDEPLVEVFSARDLALLFTPDINGIEKGNLARVAWSLDGRFLFAAGKYEKGGRKLLLRWDKSGKGRRLERAASQDMVMHLLARKDGGVFYASDDPAFGAFDSSFRRVFTQTTSIAKFQNLDDRFLVSPDGGTVFFGFDRWGQSPARFSIAARALTRDPPAAGDGFLPPVTEGEGLVIENWRDSREPTLQGRPLPLKRHERAFSLAILPDGDSFLLGTRWRLRHFDRKGAEIWNVQTPEQVWAVNVAQSGKLAILALGDGTIRWYRVADGEELLALFPHRDKRWVAWTPSGYYMASAGGDDLIGWHVNRGKGYAADFFSVSRFRDDLYRPDVVGQVLAFLDEGKALAAANRAAGRKQRQRGIAEILPPVISIEATEKAAGPDQVTLRYSLRSANGEPAAEIRIMADGRPIADIEGKIAATADGTQHRLDVTIPKNARGISVVAKNRHGVYSEAASYALTGRNAAGGKPTLYVLAVGISAYENPALRLNYANQDARDFTAIAKLQKGGLYHSVETKLLQDDKASLENIFAGLEWIQTAPQPGDVAIVFFAGHGVDDAKGNYFFLPTKVDPERLKETAMPYEKIRDALASIPARTFLFVDTCHAAGVWGGDRPPVDVNRVVNDLASPEYGVVVFASSASEQLSLESEVWRNGAFTEALLEAIGGEAAYRKKPYITVSMLDVYLSERVFELTGGKQTPTTRRPLAVPSGFRLVLPSSLLKPAE